MKLIKNLGLLLFLHCSSHVFGLYPVTIAERTFKLGINQDENLYYGFAAGDQLVIDLEIIKGKDLKAFEILEYGGVSRFMDYKTRKIAGKTLEVSKTGIYQFRFTNSSLTGKVCRIKIQRIPASEEHKLFNSTVYWKTVMDTIFHNEQENYVSKVDTVIQTLTDRVSKVHSQTNLNGDKITFNFALPKNTVSWSYYVGVDQAGQKAFEEATEEFAHVASPIIARIPGYGPLAALALNGASYLTKLQAGEDIDYYIVQDDLNARLFLTGGQFYYLKKGKVINDFSKIDAPLSGQLFFCLFNDNAVTGVSVYVRIDAVQIIKTISQREITKYRLIKRKVPYLKD